MLTSASRTPLLLALALWAAASAAEAQVIQVKPGVWASATTTTIDGRPLAAPAPENDRMHKAMKRFGLPEGAQPTFSCEHKASYDAREIAGQWKLPAECRFDLLETRPDGGRYAMRCSTPQGEAVGTGEVRVADGTEVRFNAESRVNVQGHPVLMESHTVDKWIGPDCKRPPAGIDPAWITEGDAQRD